MYIDTLLRENEVFVQAVHEAQREGRVREMAIYLERLTSSVARLGKLMDLQTLCAAQLPERRELRPPPEAEQEHEVNRTIATMATIHAVAPAVPSPYAAVAVAPPRAQAADASRAAAQTLSWDGPSTELWLRTWEG
ncbi:hypothetical protein FNF28_06734 [Cafeteria roenbergensis]|uniref:Uncharacterized protein n=1 Tax=Cafeteria roenbergensis TaxID=33653 RepID=A0A5A8CS13_CAFRO|nr:hypothetical protein FNF28_06734 [Cafeteria roenbergensis]